MNVWNEASTDYLHASCVDVQEQNRQVSIKGELRIE